MKVQQTHTFKAKAKKLHNNQLKELEFAIRTICENPSLGTKKKGDLSDVYVYKFKMNNSLQLLAYTYDDQQDLLTLLQLGSHENFYRDLKS